MSVPLVFFPNPLTLAHVQGRGREEPRRLGRGPRRFRQRGGQPHPSQKACLPGSWERPGGLQWVGSGGPQPHPGPSPMTAGVDGDVEVGGGLHSVCIQHPKHGSVPALRRLCLVPGARTGLPPRGAASWGPVESCKVLVSHWCLQAVCFPGWEPLVLSVTRRYPGTADALRPGQEGGAGGSTGWRGGAGRCCLEGGALDR